MSKAVKIFLGVIITLVSGIALTFLLVAMDGVIFNTGMTRQPELFPGATTATPVPTQETASTPEPTENTKVPEAENTPAPTAVATAEPVTATATPAPASKGFTFTFDGVEYTLGCDYSEFVKNGWVIAYDYYSMTEEDVVKSGDFRPDNTLLISDTHGVYSGSAVCCGLVNKTSGDIAIKECSTWCFGLDASTGIPFGEEYPPMSIMGLSVGDSADKVTEVLGTPTETSSGDGYNEYIYEFTVNNQLYSLRVSTFTERNVVYELMAYIE